MQSSDPIVPFVECFRIENEDTKTMFPCPTSRKYFAGFVAFFVASDYFYFRDPYEQCE